MANNALFASQAAPRLPRANTVNAAGGAAYRMGAKQALAQLAMTGCLNRTFYTEAEAQLDEVLALCRAVDPVFVAKTAAYARRKGHMKDMPALLVAALATTGSPAFAAAFGAVVDSGTMLRTVVQILRSGAVGRQSLGSRPKALVQAWLNTASDAQLISAMVGQNPSLADVVKMVHPRPKDAAREALFGYLIGKPHRIERLPQALQDFEAFKAGDRSKVAKVPFQLLTSLELGQTEWAEIDRNASWQQTRMNLNTFSRHGVFQVPGLTEAIADRLRKPALIARARVLPYQLLIAHAMTAGWAPAAIRQALASAMETALANVPAFGGKVVVLPDVSGSMQSPVTGYRRGASTAVRCVDVAALVAAAVVQKNPGAEVLPFDTKVHAATLRRHGVLKNAARLAAFGGGGTNCSLPLIELNRRRVKADLVIYVSDNESWIDHRRHGATATQTEWVAFKRRNPQARLVCIDVQPYTSTQAAEGPSVLNIGGFSDAVFPLIAAFARGEMTADHWVGQIEATNL